MIIIHHRINTISQLKSVPASCGVEIDIRDHGKDLVLQHDPFQPGELFEEYLNHFHHRFLILNVKSEGVEERVLDLIKAKNIKNYFFLDLTFPAVMKLTKKNEKNIALRYSEYEGLDTIKQMSGRVNWIWVDCFQDYPRPPEDWEELKKNFQICLVAPELQGRAPLSGEKAARVVKTFFADAVCTKTPEIWQVVQ